jgi:hypothetical protein
VKKKKKKQIEIPSNHSLKAHQTIIIIGLSPQHPNPTPATTEI